MTSPNETNVTPGDLLRRTAAAEYVQRVYGFPCSPKTLAKLACVSSNGPRFRMVGRIPLYPKIELDAWAQAKIGPLVRSTAEIAAQQMSLRNSQKNGPEFELEGQGRFDDVSDTSAPPSRSHAGALPRRRNSTPPGGGRPLRPANRPQFANLGRGRRMNASPK